MQKEKDDDKIFAWCGLFSFLVGCSLACGLTIYFFPATSSDFYAVLFYLVLSAIFISMQLYVANIIFPKGY
jgi:hypothetical protein